MEAWRVEQETLRASRSAPPPLSSVVPRGSNLLRRREERGPVTMGLPEGQATEPQVSAAADSADVDSAEYDSDEAPWPLDEGSVAAGDGELQISPPAPMERPRDQNTTRALPALDALKGRLSSEEMRLLEELFRARYVAVKRIPEGWLKGRD